MKTKNKQKIEVSEEMSFVDAIARGEGGYKEFATSRNNNEHNTLQLDGSLSVFCNQLFAWGGKIGEKYTSTLVRSSELAKIVLQKFGENIKSGRVDPRLTESEIRECLETQEDIEIKNAENLYNLRKDTTKTVVLPDDRTMTLADVIAGGNRAYTAFATLRNKNNTLQLYGTISAFCNQLFAWSGKIGGKKNSGLVTSPELAKIVLQKFGENIELGRADPRLTEAEIKECLEKQKNMEKNEKKMEIKNAENLYNLRKDTTKTVVLQNDRVMTLADAIAGGDAGYRKFAISRNNNEHNTLQLDGSLHTFCNQLFAWSGEIGGKKTFQLVQSRELAEIVLQKFGENIKSKRSDPRLTESEIRECRARYRDQ